MFRWILSPFSLICCGLVAVASHVAAQVDPFTSARYLMVQKYVASAGVTHQRVLQSMKSCRAHEFVTSDQRRMAYYDMALPLGEGQTISPPYIVAFMETT